MPGTVLTFYSYKGGVGRSFALANIAVLLARWGHKVLCVDWDLEAPGLHDYFRPLMNAEPAGGVIDLVDDFRAGRADPPSHTTRLTGDGTLDLIVAGQHDPDYTKRVQDIEWDSLYDQGFGEYLERCRERWTAEYDFVLLDSRTGISDVGGICTAQLPDRLVVLFTPNVQSMRGAVDVARRADAARDKLPFDRPRLVVLPVLSRFDAREEYAQAERWRSDCVNETKGLYHNWLHQEVSVEVMSRHLTVPYVSYWAFGEQLAVNAEREPTVDQISYALETIAAVIAQDLDRTALLAENRDAYVAAVRSAKREFTHDIVVSAARPAMHIADDLVAALTELGLTVRRSLSGDRARLATTEDTARHLCLLVDGRPTAWQSAEAELFLYRTLGQDRRVIPVLTSGTLVLALPGYLANLRHLRLAPGHGPAEVARSLADQVRGITSIVDTDGLDPVALLRQAARAVLRPERWQLVDDTVHDLRDAAAAGDSARLRDFAADLALATRPRARQGKHDQRVPAPGRILADIEFTIGVLNARIGATGTPPVDK
ncbi:CATRA system-associated protein [Actinokineospora enzanensis]|uniref:CATRA system-associated protein n=1 Tax=Actinokineospora enzanensis TaxID=155975 RepID=UPI000524CD8C|nr:CATRA system-associated protein [Actinokineospora enzanensis]